VFGFNPKKWHTGYTAKKVAQVGNTAKKLWQPHQKGAQDVYTADISADKEVGSPAYLAISRPTPALLHLQVVLLGPMPSTDEDSLQTLLGRLLACLLLV
jgi:hypothetical protein